LALIARSLLACCATEAAVERLFSKEGFIHDSYRNRLGHDVLLALVRSCMNRHAMPCTMNLSTSTPMNRMIRMMMIDASFSLQVKSSNKNKQTALLGGTSDL
jgi:hypothetical protein